MAEFKYTAVDPEGVIVGETIVAENEEEVEAQLKKEELSIINLHLIPEARETLVDKMFNRVTDTDKAQFLEFFASMLEAGLTVSDVLQAFYEDLDKPLLRKFVKDTQYGIRNGRKLSECFADYPKLFPQLYVGMVQVGEAAGTLAESLRHLANQLKKNNELRSKVKAAMIYPTVLIVALVSVITILLIFVFPKLEEFFSNASLELPALTKGLLKISEFLRNYWFLVIAGILGGFYGYKEAQKSYKLRLIIDKQKLRIPLVGKLMKTTNVALMSRTLGSLLASGVNILEAMDVVQTSLSNQVFKNIMDVVKEDLTRGNSLSDSLKKFPDYFSPFEVRVLSISDRTGELSDGLQSIAEFYENKLYGLLGGLTATLEPVLLLFMGGVVVIVAISVITPIYQLLSGVQNI